MQLAHQTDLQQLTGIHETTDIHYTLQKPYFRAILSLSNLRVSLRLTFSNFC
uniref:Uncharacterized protein n=1 Tax=Siphoviridae sp. ctt0c4 TaxID=2825702 RepID=A0A8S5V3I0_9CAUD|nr:MAG TPA: hypothetical protein [Siphoviridae sp. ctt0c4]